MRRSSWAATVLVCLAAGFALVPQAGAQVPTGVVTGRVTDANGEGLPGVTVTATSPNLQGQRVVTTNTNGDYKLPVLPAGEYQLTFELENFQTKVIAASVLAAQTKVVDMTMELSEVKEEIVVTGKSETISEGTSVSSTYTEQEVESLPIARNIVSAASLAPGVHATGPKGTNDRDGNITISGSMSFENLWLVNGVEVNENLRGQPLALFIEDAIQEQTVSTAGVSAEYGRFSGGVVNVLTKSGGNQFSGSIRDNFTNDSWQARTPQTADGQTDKTNSTYEGTLGGFFWKDHLWFFGAGRDRKLDNTATLAITEIPYQQTDKQTRYEGKLTLSPVANHTIIGSYLKIDQKSTNQGFLDNLDLASLTDREDPQDLTAVNYNGIFGAKFYAEAQYSERNYDIAKGAGGPRSLYDGSTWETSVDSTTWHAPFFCGQCEQEQRNNKNFLAKGSLFLSSASAGTHDVIFGYDTFKDVRFAVNHQSGSDFRLAGSGFLVDPQTKEVFPVVDNQGGSWASVWPVFGLENVHPTDFRTNSYYVNDRWQLNDKWAFNVGVRYDANDGKNAGGVKVANDSKISPRLGATWDVKGDGDLILNASYGKYVAAIANNRANSTSTGGAIGRALLLYDGAPINTDPSCLDTHTCVSSDDATHIIIDWWFANGGINPLTDDPNLIATIPNAVFLIVPGTVSNSVIPNTIKSPSTDEVSLGFNKRLGTKGQVRADLIYRNWTDFYSNRTTLETGTVTIGGRPVDLTEVGNFGNKQLERQYSGLHTQWRYRFTDRFTFAGTYTLSQLRGNIDGETSGSGPITASPNDYPEFKQKRWNFPVGDLGADQRHKLSMWGIYDILAGEHNHLSVSLLESYFSGTPYGALGAVSTRFQPNPGYHNLPPNVGYYFTARDAFHTDDITSTDLSFNYSFAWKSWGRNLEVFLQPEVLNLFNEQGVVDVNTAVLDATNSSSLQTFNPLTDTPVEGVNWKKGSNFGKPTSEFDYQQPRVFRFSVGFRF